ncbi:MAG: hypothetical protein JRN20_01020 [Nitrososphaerota archaeon]|nr:hypothetical protein [Nitrososphaerota archaeon]
MGPSNLIYSVTAAFTPSSPLAPVSGEPKTITQYVPEVTVGQSIILIGYYNISPSASPGVYNQTLNVSYTNGTYVFNQVVSFNVPILGSSSIVVSGYTYNPTFVYPGTSLASLQVYVQNTGSSVASNVSARLLTSYPVSAAYNGSTSAIIGYLPVGSAVPLTFVLSIANTSTPVNASLTLVVNYNRGLSQRFAIPFMEQPKAILQLQSVFTPKINIGDGSDYVTLAIKNIGTVSAQYAIVTMLPSNVFSPSIPSSESPLLALTASNQSVGTIPPGQTVNVTYIIQVSSSIPQGQYSLGFLVSWRQSTATTPFVQELTTSVLVQRTLMQSISSNFANPLVDISLFATIILVIVAVVFALRSRRRNKKQ